MRSILQVLHYTYYTINPDAAIYCTLFPNLPDYRVSLVMVEHSITKLPLTTVCLVHTNLFESSTESFEDLLHVASLLHGDHPGVVFLIHPD